MPQRRKVRSFLTPLAHSRAASRHFCPRTKAETCSPVTRERPYDDEDSKLPPPVFTPGLLVAFTDRVHDRPFAEDLLTAMAANPKVFRVETLLDSAWALSLERETDPGTRAMLWRLCATALLRRSEYPPPAPTDWADPTPDGAVAT